LRCQYGESTSSVNGITITVFMAMPLSSLVVLFWAVC
jgi:hypothetical protein